MSYRLCTLRTLVPSAMRNRYLLCIEAPADVAEQVRALSAALEPLIGRAHKSTAPPHITLLLVDMDSEHEQELTALIAKGLVDAKPFHLTIAGITHFKDLRTIYADPVQKEAVLALVAPVARLVQASAAIHQYKPSIADHPHLTIASGLKPPKFQGAWAAMKEASCKGSFMVKEVTLMVRPLEPGTRYVSLQRFAIEG